MLNCDKMDSGCNGGRLDYEWDFIENKGISTDDCTPYKNGVRPSSHFRCS